MEVIRREARRKDIVIGMRLKEISLLEEGKQGLQKCTGGEFRGCWLIISIVII